jgi:methylated-DNA-protein-cysteine methyltransferase-like protein
MNPFYKNIYAIVGQIPYGKVISYWQIARIAGKPRGAREVGWAMRHCPEHFPWQRVVMADGTITGGMYADMRKGILESEGVTFLADGRVDMAVCRVDDEFEFVLDGRNN